MPERAGSPRRVPHPSFLVDIWMRVESSGLRPVIDKVFSFEDAKAAYAHLEKGDHMGKVVIRFD